VKCAPGCTCARHKSGPGADLSNAEITYQALHRRIRRRRGNASQYTCTDCPAQATDWSQVHGTDGLDLDADYAPRCRSCHIRYDADARLNESSRQRWAAGVAAYWTPARRAERGKQAAAQMTPERRKSHSKRISQLHAEGRYG
jgi:hypothetical protein